MVLTRAERILTLWHFENDRWAHDMSRTLVAPGSLFRESGHAAPPRISELIAGEAFEYRSPTEWPYGTVASLLRHRFSIKSLASLTAEEDSTSFPRGRTS